MTSEICRYCGRAGAHAPDCPTRQKIERAEPWDVDDRESSVPGFSMLEVHEATGIVDWGKRLSSGLLDKVAPGNLDALIAAEEARIADQRRDQNTRELTGMSAEETIDKLYLRNSSSHAFQCSVNKSVDFGTYFERIRRIGGERGIDADDSDLVFLTGFLRRQEKMNDLMTGLLEKDIARRFGELKGDGSFFEKAMADFPDLADKLLGSLDAHEAANAKALAGNEDVRRQLDNLRGRLAAAKGFPPGSLEADFYGDICMAYSILIFEDAEVFNEDAVRDAAARLTKSGS